MLSIALSIRAHAAYRTGGLYKVSMLVKRQPVLRDLCAAPMYSIVTCDAKCFQIVPV